MSITELRSPFWLPAGDQTKPYPRPDGDLRVDVAIVGGGIVGLTAAHFLQAAGREVALFEARRIGRQATGRSTAKVTSQHGRRYSRLLDDIGTSRAALYASANERAIARIREICATFSLDCGLQSQPAYIFAETAEEASSLRTEAAAAAGLGLPASFVTDLALPFPVTGAVRFDNQAQFDPYRYLVGLAEAVSGEGLVFERTRVTEVEHGRPCRLQAGDVQVTADHVVVASQMPVIAHGMYFAKAFPVAHPVAAAPATDVALPGGMFINSGSPTHSFRTAERDGATYVVATGGAFKTGTPEDQAAMVADLRDFLRSAFHIEELSNLWINEDFRPMDGLPFIGRVNAARSRFFVATGFDAWGITQGTVAAGIITDLILGRSNDAAEIFDAARLRPLAGGRELVAENLKAGAHLLKDRLLRRRVRELEDIPDNEGGIVELDGEQVAVIKNGREITALSAACTHLGCIVGWNAVDRTWDCPCHGSRFDTDGEVISGPATAPLAPVSVGSTPGDESEPSR